MSGAAQVWQRLRLLFAQGVGTLINVDTVQATVLDDETLPKIKRVEPYGLSYHPKPGCEVYVVFPAGDRARGVALVIGDKRYQMDLAEGEVALHDDDGNFVKLGTGGVATVKASAKVIADTPLFETTGNAVIGGTLSVAGATTLQAGVAVAGAAAFAGNVGVAGALTQNGVGVGGDHTHTSAGPGQQTSGVTG